MKLWIKSPYKDPQINNMFNWALVDAVGECKIKIDECDDGYKYTVYMYGNSNTAKVVLYKFFSRLKHYTDNAYLFTISDSYYRVFASSASNGYDDTDLKSVSKEVRCMRIDTDTKDIDKIKYGFELEDENKNINRNLDHEFLFSINSIITNTKLYVDDTSILKTSKTIHLHNCMCGISIHETVDEKEDVLYSRLACSAKYNDDISINDLISLFCSTVVNYMVGRVSTRNGIALTLSLLFKYLSKDETKEYMKYSFIEFYKSVKYCDHNLEAEFGGKYNRNKAAIKFVIMKEGMG